MEKQTQSDKQQGLVMKYFVLKPCGIDAFAIASREAMRAYSRSIHHVNPVLSKELWDWADREEVGLQEARDRQRTEKTEHRE